MTHFNGPMGPSQKYGHNKGVMRVLREEKRAEAETRDQALPADSPRRKRNRGTVIVAPPVFIGAEGRAVS